MMRWVAPSGPPSDHPAEWRECEDVLFLSGWRVENAGSDDVQAHERRFEPSRCFFDIHVNIGRLLQLGVIIENKLSLHNLFFADLIDFDQRILATRHLMHATAFPLLL